MYNYYNIIDTSYIIYYAANSAFGEYVRDCDILETQQGPTFDPSIDPEYISIFEEKFRQCIERPVQNLIPFPDKSNYIFCLDCQRKNIWRRAIFPEYKIQRDVKDTSKDKFDIGSSFRYAYNYIIPSICDEWDAHILRCEFGEGDDCISVVTKYILDKNKFNKVIIVSCDKDMVQLYNNRTTIITTEGLIRKPKIELEKAIKEKIGEEVSSTEFLLWKIILGDKSDGIPNIKPGIGNKKAYKLLKNKDELKELLASDINIARAFKRNKTLISLNEIPEEVTSLIIEEINDSVFKNKCIESINNL